MRRAVGIERDQEGDAGELGHLADEQGPQRVAQVPCRLPLGRGQTVRFSPRPVLGLVREEVDVFVDVDGVQEVHNDRRVVGHWHVTIIASLLVTHGDHRRPRARRRPGLRELGLLGGFASRRLAALEVTFVAFAAGTLACGALLPLAGSRFSLAALGYGALAGVTAAGSIWLLYSALAMGPVSVLAPMVAVIAGLVPVLYGLSHGERLGPLGEGAIGVVLFSAAFLAYDPTGHDGRVRSKAIALGLAAGVVTGLFLVSLDLTPTASGAAPVLIEFAVGAGLLGVSVLFRRLVSSSRSRDDESLRVPRTPFRFAIGSGVTQAIADVLVIVGIHRGHLAVMAALMALYPLGTLACGRVVLHERLSRVQAVAVIAAVAASAVLASTGRG